MHPTALGTVFFRDRKSTRLNSSHLVISYAVFCLKKSGRRDAACGADELRLPPGGCRRRQRAPGDPTVTFRSIYRPYGTPLAVLTIFFLMLRRSATSTLFPSAAFFRSP